jgi:hypothetical protein
VVPYIIPVPVYEGVLNNVKGLLAVANTALDDTNNTLVAAQQKILTLEIQKHASEDALLNKVQPVIHDDEEPRSSPSPKKPCYDSYQVGTEALPWNRTP